MPITMLTTLEPCVKRPKRKVRYGRGFSINELKESGVTLEQARRLKIRIDRRRSSKWPENVARLKEFSTSIKAAARKESRKSPD